MFSSRHRTHLFPPAWAPWDPPRGRLPSPRFRPGAPQPGLLPISYYSPLSRSGAGDSSQRRAGFGWIRACIDCSTLPYASHREDSCQHERRFRPRSHYWSPLLPLCKASHSTAYPQNPLYSARNNSTSLYHPWLPSGAWKDSIGLRCCDNRTQTANDSSTCTAGQRTWASQRHLWSSNCDRSATLESSWSLSIFWGGLRSRLSKLATAFFWQKNSSFYWIFQYSFSVLNSERCLRAGPLFGGLFRCDGCGRLCSMSWFRGAPSRSRDWFQPRFCFTNKYHRGSHSSSHPTRTSSE